MGWHNVWYVGWGGTLAAIIPMTIIAVILVFGGKWRLPCAAIFSTAAIAFVTFLWVRDWSMCERVSWAFTTESPGLREHHAIGLDSGAGGFSVHFQQVERTEPFILAQKPDPTPAVAYQWRTGNGPRDPDDLYPARKGNTV